MLTYRTEMSNRPPVPEDVQKRAMAEMRSMAPAGGRDAYNSTLNLAAYQNAANEANRDYGHSLQGQQQQMALAGLTSLAQQRQQSLGFLSSLLGPTYIERS